MRDWHAYDYAVIRVVPQVEREEFVNVGVILSCPDLGFLGTRLRVDETRLLALAPELDVADVRAHLAAFETVCRGGAEAGPLGAMTARQRFYWLVAPRSTVIQTSATHTGLCIDPADTLERLLTRYVR